MSEKSPTDTPYRQPEAGRRRVVVKTPSLNELRDLASLRRDFMLAASFLDFYLASEIEDDAESPSPTDALWIAAVTAYGRAFGTGQRHAGRVEMTSLDAESVRAHMYFIDLRNKYIAHSVNGFEATTVFADLTDPAQEQAGIELLGELHTRLSRLSRERAVTLKWLCDHHVSALAVRIDRLHRQVANELTELGQEAAYAMPDFSPPTLEGMNPRSKRR
ncbi:hypothetical protein G7068_10705 [Leucobacter viscericola]|uniref:Uncharacterized protein n=1 Tax=Leucobacter viscericola TaxID=2714935 RepID=A0A6G7XG72_9MICO|nr:hypothetical protein [Leucobacter viscericola]QIK63610.1 hypothetical protein G7068_10705 [Leucobacter viscericola]